MPFHFKVSKPNFNYFHIEILYFMSLVLTFTFFKDLLVLLLNFYFYIKLIPPSTNIFMLSLSFDPYLMLYQCSTYYHKLWPFTEKPFTKTLFCFYCCSNIILTILIEVQEKSLFTYYNLATKFFFVFSAHFSFFIQKSI